MTSSHVAGMSTTRAMHLGYAISMTPANAGWYHRDETRERFEEELQRNMRFVARMHEAFEHYSVAKTVNSKHLGPIMTLLGQKPNEVVTEAEERAIVEFALAVATVLQPDGSAELEFPQFLGTLHHAWILCEWWDGPRYGPDGPLA